MDYSPFTESIEIPFKNLPGGTPAIDVYVNDTLVEKAGLDTGSSVFALEKGYVKDFDKVDTSKFTAGEISYTSGIKWTGFYYPVNVTFEGKNGIKATAAVEVLVITKQSNPKDDKYWEDVHYIGCGFAHYDEKNGYVPAKNALLSITQFNGTDIKPGTFRHGYIVRESSVILGLTATNTTSFKYTQLTNTAAPNVPWYWDRVHASLRLNQDPWMPGKALVDTGLDGMQFCSTQYSSTMKTLPAGTVISVRFPDENSDLPEYSFTWPGKDAKTRDAGVPEDLDYVESIFPDQSFVNTGRNFLEVFDVLFDADGGLWGIRPATE